MDEVIRVQDQLDRESLIGMNWLDIHPRKIRRQEIRDILTAISLCFIYIYIYIFMSICVCNEFEVI